ncbi:MAG: peptidoglycan-binding protein [Acidaminococcaceae bacterium]|nr:peptidoglycan-binding protein [Acidaminococcaceae bacterium]
MSNSSKVLALIRSYSYYWSSDSSNRLNDIALMQKALNDLGFNCGTPGGIYNSSTVTGVRAFQAAKGLTVDGLFGSASLAALENTLGHALDFGTIFIGKVSANDVAVRNKPNGTTIYGRYPKDMWIAARTVPNDNDWYAVLWKGKTTVSGYMMSTFVPNRTSKMSTALCATGIANNLVGKTKTFLGLSGDWCQSFCNIVMKASGVTTLQAPVNQSNAYTAYNWFSTNNRLFSTPALGDVAYFKWNGSTNNVDHASLVVSVGGSSITVCEGNRGSNQTIVQKSTFQRNDSQILGYGRPKW